MLSACKNLSKSYTKKVVISDNVPCKENGNSSQFNFTAKVTWRTNKHSF